MAFLDGRPHLGTELTARLWRALQSRAVLGVGYGVAEHSTTLVRPIDRLRTTMTYVYAVTLGTPEEKRAVVRLVNRAHVPVRSDRYNAFDPDLQLWVAATLYRNGSDMFVRFFGDLSEADKERLYRQSAVYGTALQVKESMWPADRAAFGEYWDRMIETVEIDDQVRAFVRKLLSGGDAPPVIRLLMPMQRFFTIGLLPPRLREEFRLPWSPRDQRRFDRVMQVLPGVYRRIPRQVRQLPATYYLRDMRRRLAAHKHLI